MYEYRCEKEFCEKTEVTDDVLLGKTVIVLLSQNIYVTTNRPFWEVSVTKTKITKLITSALSFLLLSVNSERNEFPPKNPLLQ